MRSLLSAWQFWALLSAVFAAMTAVLAKIGVENISSDLATFVRTIVIVIFAGAIVAGAGEWQAPSTIAARTWVFLVLSGFATGLSWLCYFRAIKLGDVARVQPIDKLSVVFVAIIAAFFLRERLSTLNWLGIVLIAGGAVLVAQQG